MKVLEIKSDRIKVESNGMTTVVAKYQDSKGIYFMNENLEKEYVNTTTPKKVKKVSKLPKFNFLVEYFQGDFDRRKLVEVAAKDFDSAINKVQKRFKHIILIEQC